MAYKKKGQDQDADLEEGQEQPKPKKAKAVRYEKWKVEMQRVPAGKDDEGKTIYEWAVDKKLYAERSNIQLKPEQVDILNSGASSMNPYFYYPEN